MTKLLLIFSLLIGSAGVGLCGLVRAFLMNSPADWLTIDYTLAGWLLRVIAAAIGAAALVLALLSRRSFRQRNPAWGWLYLLDVVLALTAIAYELALPILLLLLVIHFVGGALARSVDAHTSGCLLGGLDLFDIGDND